MGRHSAPDDEDVGRDERAADAPPATSVATVSRGRHAREDASRPRPSIDHDHDATIKIPLAELARHDRPLPEEVTAKITPVADALEPRPHPAPADAETSDQAHGTHGTRHDLALVLSHGDVRARVLAAVLVPFVVYVVVLAIVDALTVHSLVWLWAPAIAAGVLVGFVLDAGHRRYPAPDAVSEPAPPN